MRLELNGRNQKKGKRTFSMRGEKSMQRGMKWSGEGQERVLMERAGGEVCSFGSCFQSLMYMYLCFWTAVYAWHKSQSQGYGVD